jgi:PhzF family phenazine biosynthesis protein
MSQRADTSRPFTQVDVFADTPLRGNPVAVVLDASGLDSAQMQRFTDWTNLSEATFLAPPTHPEADYSVRVFCPGRELPFAGHPTLGSCHAWLEAGGMPRGDVIVQECGVGLVRIRRDPDTAALSFSAPPLRRSGPLDPADLAALIRGLHLEESDVVDHQWCDNGPQWRALLLRSAERVLAVQPDPAVIAGMDVGIVGPHPRGDDARFEVRAFFPGNQGVTEDPVTGSLNAALGQWLIGSGQAPRRYVAAQGTAVGRAGRVTIEWIGDDVWVGGRCVSVLRGTATL